MRIDPQDLDWHDGRLVDVRISGLADERQDLTLIVDLYAENAPKDRLRRYRCTGTDLKRILIHGDVARLIQNRNAGNVDFMRMESTDDGEFLVVVLFGGVVEAEASTFHLTEVEP